MEAFIQLGLFLSLLFIGYFFGRRAEKQHYKSITQREDQLRDIYLSTDRFPTREYLRHDTQLVQGSVVISVDYFKVILSGLKNLVGGRLTAYESLLDRARREAILRMQSEAKALNAHAVINTKFETSRISGSAGQGIGSIEVLAYGTAMIPRA